MAVVAVVALAVFAPWMVRDWIEFHNPLPGQALANALSVTGFDIFAWNDPPTLSRYLGEGPARLLEMRVDGIGHNLFTVLLLPGIPAAIVGLVALPWFVRLRSLRPLGVLSVITFAVTSLLFPVSTTWGTYLHAAGPAHVLLIVCALLALDAAIERIGRMRGWTNPVAWLGGALTISGSLLFMVALMPSFGGQSRAIENRYEALTERMAAVGLPPAEQRPIITNFPIWLADATGAPALALPAETPADVLDLAEHFGAELVIVHGDGHGAASGRRSSPRTRRAPSASRRSSWAHRPSRGWRERSRTPGSSGSFAHEWRPVYSEADGRCTLGYRAPRGGPARATRVAGGPRGRDPREAGEGRIDALHAEASAAVATARTSCAASASGTGPRTPTSWPAGRR